MLKFGLENNLLELLSKGIETIDLATLVLIASDLRRDYNIDFLKLLSKEDRDILEKRGCVIFAPFDDGMERIYPAKKIKNVYEKFHYNKEILMESMTLDGATSMDIDNECCKLDEFLRTDVSSKFDDPDVEFTQEQYQRAKTYLEVENFIDSCKLDINLNPSERLNIISNLVDYTLAISSNNDVEDRDQNVSARVLSIINNSL